MAFDIDMIKKVYANMTSRVDKARELGVAVLDEAGLLALLKSTD